MDGEKLSDPRPNIDPVRGTKSGWFWKRMSTGFIAVSGIFGPLVSPLTAAKRRLLRIKRNTDSTTPAYGNSWNNIHACASQTNLPRTYPVLTEKSLGAAFLLRAGILLTCNHVVRDSRDIRVAGAQATVLASCPADIAILHVPALNKCAPVQNNDEQFSKDDIVFKLNLRPELPVLITHPSGMVVRARLQEIQTILYSASGASLPSLRLVNGHVFSNVTVGWSGSPVICAQTRLVVGMLVHGMAKHDDSDQNSPAYSELHAVPGMIMRWLWRKHQQNKSSTSKIHHHWYGMGAIEMLRLHSTGFSDNLEADESAPHLKRPMEKDKTSYVRFQSQFAARVLKAARHSGLLPGDIILEIRGMKVDKNCRIKWAGAMVAGLEAAFIGTEPGDNANAVVLRDCKTEGPRLLKVNVLLGSAEKGPLCLTARSRNLAVDAGCGTVRFVEISVERLVQWHGKDWVEASLFELDSIVAGSIAKENFEWREYVVIDMVNCRTSTNCQKTSGTRKCCWSHMGGMLVLKVNGEEVRRLEDIIDASRTGNVKLEMQNGCIASLPEPIVLVNDTLSSSSIITRTI